ncbi:MAG TPA: LysM peptidoglycan-binding domain-containing protein [Saprospiraceae bacterium]|nr:LysM peptidoglycan-binding domain-containing protein [Saprospiraceae bacterium]
MIRSLTVFTLLFTGPLLDGQRVSGNILLCQDTLLVQSSEDGSLYLQWRVGRTTTLNTITAATGCTAFQLQALNPILHFRDIEPCDLILTSFDIRRLETSSATASYPVYYRVRQGETIFGLAKRMLQIPVDTLMRMNALYDSNVRMGQLLFLGKLNTSVSGIYFRNGHLTNTLTSHHGYAIDSQMVNTSPDKHYAKQKGVAWWNKSKQDPNLFVLHRMAPVNSLIEIRNPMFGRSVWAKVIGTIPPTYPDDISVIVSQGIARTLGAIDGRFHVEISYEIR